MTDYAYVHVPVCQKAVEDKNIFESFKKDSNFTTILEHTDEQYSHIFMQRIINEYRDYINKINWNLVKENDAIGTAHLVEYSELSNSVKLDNYLFSPSTVAYIFKALDVLNHVKKSELNNIHILEIGAGYGGQCKILFDLADIFNVNIKKYTLVDLYWPNQLQKKYLNTLGYKDRVEFISYEQLLEDNSSLPEFDYLISIYALGEFNSDTQQFYIDKINNLKYYYLVWNTLSIHERFLLGDIEEEYPKTGPHNVVIKSRTGK